MFLEILVPVVVSWTFHTVSETAVALDREEEVSNPALQTPSYTIGMG